LKQVVGELPIKKGKPTFSPTKVDAAKAKGLRIVTEKELLQQLDYKLPG
jgi:hypothetical protein